MALLTILPCLAQLPPGVLYSTTVPYSIPPGTIGAGKVLQQPTINAVVTDALGNSYVTGSAYVTGFASTPGVVQPANAGGTCSFGEFGQDTGPCPDAFIAKFDSSGTLTFLTYLGGTGSDTPSSLVVDASGNVYVGGQTNSTDFPLAGTPYQPTLMNPRTFLAKLSSDGKTLIWSTVLNEPLGQLALAADGSVYYLSITTLTGAVTLTKLTADGHLVAIGNEPSGTEALAISTDGSVYIGGFSDGTNVTATPGAWQTTYGGSQDGFVAKVNASLSGFAWLTFVGGSGSDAVYQMETAPDGSLWAGANTTSSNIPVPPGALQPQLSPGIINGYLVHLSADGSKALASTYLPVPVSYLSLDPSGNAIFGALRQTGFQATPGTPWPCPFTGLGGGFIGKVDSAGQHLLWGTWTGPSVPSGPVTVDKSGNVVAAGADVYNYFVLSAMTTVPGPPRLACIAQSAFPYYAGTLAPGEIFSIYNAGFGPAQGVSGPSGNTFGTELGGVRVLVEGVYAPLLYVSSAQINLVAPYFLNGRVAAHIKIVTASATSNEVVLGVQQAVPEIFEIFSNNPGLPPAAAILNPDGTVNSHDHPAHVGDIVAMFVSGVGQTNPPAVDGAIATAAGGTPLVHITVQLTTSSPSVKAKVTYAGNAPGLVSGVTQLNFQVPSLKKIGAGPPYYATIGLYVGGPFSADYGPVIWFE